MKPNEAFPRKLEEKGSIGKYYIDEFIIFIFKCYI